MVEEFFQLSLQVKELAQKAQEICESAFAQIDAVCEYNSLKVLAAFQKHQVSESHLLGTSGYGYGDRGRDTLDEVWATVFGAEDALVRHSFASGTAAIATALFGLLRPGDVMVSLSGTPYDTLHSVLGLREKNIGSLAEFGVIYRELPLLPDGKVDLQAIPQAVKA